MSTVTKTLHTPTIQLSLTSYSIVVIMPCNDLRYKIMKITAIKTFIANFGNRSRGLIKVETDEEIHGWGEAYSTGPDLSVNPLQTISLK